MKDRHNKVSASSARAGFGQSSTLAFGAAKGSSFGSASSAISYLAEQPDPSLITDPNVTVNFKNLLKKDSTTKSKALDELLAYLSSLLENKQDLEDGFIQAWIKLFPRLSIDVSRRVRQSTFALHKAVSKASGKRLAKYMPLIAPAWLAGSYDGDKGVMRAAYDGLQSIFGTPEKQKNLRKAYQPQILAFGIEIVENETKDSLSDPKNTTPEDAEAVYNRVLSSSLSVISDVISTLDQRDLEAEASRYDGLVASNKLWLSLSQGDTAARRAILRLARAYFSMLPTYVTEHSQLIAKVMTSNRTIRRQTGTSHMFIEILRLLIGQKPQELFGNSVAELLQTIGKNGSQGVNAQFWVNFAELFAAVPDSLLPTKYEDVAKMLEAISQGIGKKDELVTNQPDAYRCYFRALVKLSENLPPEDKGRIALDWGFAIVRHYIKPQSDSRQWPLSSSHALLIVADALRNNTLQDVAVEQWPSVTGTLLDDLRTSLPAQAKDFEQSQMSVEKEAICLLSLQGKLAGSEIPQQLNVAFSKATVDIVQESVQLLKSRDGKPYGAAGCIVAALEQQSWTLDSMPSDLTDRLDNFLLSELPNLLFSPSGSRLVHILYLNFSRDSFHAAWSTSLENIISHTDSEARETTLWAFLTSVKAPVDAKIMQENDLLQSYLRKELMSAAKSNNDFVLWERGFAQSPPVLSNDTVEYLIKNLSENLIAEDDSIGSGLEGFKRIARRRPDLLQSYADSEKGADFIQNLLKVQERAEDSEAMAATELLSTLNAGAASDGSLSSGGHAAKVLDGALYDADANSLAVATLVGMAMSRFKASQDAETLTELLPDTRKWADSLHPFLSVAPPPSFALSDELGGALDIVSSSQTADISFQPPPVDAEGLTPLLRMSLYTICLLAQAEEMHLQSSGIGMRKEMFGLILLTAEVANDRLSYNGANPLYAGDTGDEYASEFLGKAREYLRPMIKPNITLAGISNDGDELLDPLFYRSSNLSSVAIHQLRAWQRAKREAVEGHAWHSEDPKRIESSLMELRKNEDHFIQLIAFVAAFSVPLSGSAALVRVVNESVAGLTVIDISVRLVEATKIIVLLNTILGDHEGMLDAVAKQRIIFLVKHVVPWLAQQIPNGFKAEICRCLSILLAHIKDVYGEDWEKILEFLSVCWTDAQPLTKTSASSSVVVLWHSSLKLFAVLRRLTQDEDTNEDLKDAWKEKLDDLAQGLANLLKQSGRLPDASNQPLRATNEVLARQIKAVPARKLGDLASLYALLDTQSREVQQTAFDILHRQIPQEQEEISVNVALNKSTARLPDELLSLIFQTPDPDLYENFSFERTIPSSLFTYLSSWVLVFDHFKKASHKAQSDYVAHIKEQGVHTSLLNVIFASLGHAQSRPIDASKFDPTFYSFNIEPEPKREVQWLLIHLYYLCLLRLPSLTKAWWIDCRSRQIRSQVEPWTEKFFSPLVISDALQAAADWSRQQDPNSEDALNIKANEKAKEVTASKEVDDQQLTIAIRLPPNFPLGSVTVEGVNRVAVEEKKWKNWLLNTQGVITFSDNSIADGLIAFRRNVSGQLKGQTECAICYSMVSQDKQLPTKKCKTCKNMFHGSCLYRWFKSSNSSSCPLCRTAFHYA